MSNDVTNYIVAFRKYWEKNTTKGSRNVGRQTSSFQEEEPELPTMQEPEPPTRHVTYSVEEVSSEPQDVEVPSKYSVLIFIRDVRSDLDEWIRKLSENDYRPYVVTETRSDGREHYRLMVGWYNNEREALGARRSLKRKFSDFASNFPFAVGIRKINEEEASIEEAIATEPVVDHNDPNPNTRSAEKTIYKRNEEVYAAAYDMDHQELLNEFWAWHAVPLFLEGSTTWHQSWSTEMLNVTFRGMRVMSSAIRGDQRRYLNSYGISVIRNGYNIRRNELKSLLASYKESVDPDYDRSRDETFTSNDLYDLFWNVSFNLFDFYLVSPFNHNFKTYEVYNLEGHGWYDPNNLPPMPESDDLFSQTPNPHFKDVSLKEKGEGNDLVNYHFKGVEWNLESSRKVDLPLKRADNDLYFIKSLFKEYCKADFYKRFNSKKTLIKYLKNNQNEATAQNITRLKFLVDGIGLKTSESSRGLATMESENNNESVLEALQLINDNLKNKIILTTRGEFFFLLGDKVELNFCLNLESKRLVKGAKSFLRVKICNVVEDRIQVYDDDDWDESAPPRFETVYYRKQSEWVYSGKRRSIVPYELIDDERDNRRRWESAMHGYAVATVKKTDQNYEYEIVNSRNTSLTQKFCNTIVKNFNKGNSRIGLSGSQTDSIFPGYSSDRFIGESICTKAININKLLPSFTVFPNENLNYNSRQVLDLIKEWEGGFYQEYLICRDFLAINEIDCVFEFTEKELKPKSSTETPKVSRNAVIIFDKNEGLA